MNIIRYKYLFLTIAGVLVLASIGAVIFWGMKLGTDFTGGAILEIEYPQGRPQMSELKKSVDALSLGEVTFEPLEEKGVLLRGRALDEESHQKILSRLRQLGLVEERRFDAIGPTIGHELKVRSIIAIVVASVLIILYIAWAFRKVSRPVASWKYGVVAVFALLHDVILPAGIFSVLGHFRGVEIDSLFITALLTIMGFSVHDTIVVFDRTRENLSKPHVNEPYAQIVNKSINETMARSITTSLTVLLVLFAIFFFGGQTTHYFSLALIVGIAFGMYSSIFVASPLLVLWDEVYTKKKI